MALQVMSNAARKVAAQAAALQARWAAPRPRGPSPGKAGRRGDELEAAKEADRVTKDDDQSVRKASQEEGPRRLRRAAGHSEPPWPGASGKAGAGARGAPQRRRPKARRRKAGEAL